MNIHDFKLANVTLLHHHSQKLNNDPGAQPGKNLEFASLLCIVDALQTSARTFTRTIVAAWKDIRKKLLRRILQMHLRPQISWL